MGRMTPARHASPISDSPALASIHLEGVTKRYGAVEAVRGVTLEVAAGSFFSLLGPSGCGKTTLLRLIGGFETPDGGTIRIGEADVTRRPPQARPTAMVFQSYALFPTMTVGQNVGYGLSVRGEKGAVVREKVDAALRRVDLAGLGDRPVAALSGGQQQRVALARALATEPAVLLFDEPLSNLDVALREATRAELKTLQRDLGTTSVYVTHDQQEALALSDRIAVMQTGRIVGEGTPEALYHTPETAFVARFLGGANVIEHTGLAERLAGEPRPSGYALSVRPEALEPAPSDAAHRIPARVVSRQFLGTHAEWAIEAEGQALRLWTAAEAPVPDELFVRAARWRWVRTDTPMGT
jgi:ABC-type Fe3+/spermidine/putrescine transport system ATPase subunit